MLLVIVLHRIVGIPTRAWGLRARRGGVLCGTMRSAVANGAGVGLAVPRRSARQEWGRSLERPQRSAL